MYCHKISTSNLMVPSYPLIFRLPMVFVVLILATLLSSHNTVYAEQNKNSPSPTTLTTSQFQKQLFQPLKNTKPTSSVNLFQKAMASSPMFDGSPINLLQADKDLAFNYLWMLQYQQNYRQKTGGAAVGKLFRMGVKSLYKTYSVDRSVLSTSKPLNRNIFDYSLFDYSLRVSEDKVKFGIEYEF